jgi:hypothetical protein
MVLFLSYALIVSGILWYTIGFLPFPELSENISFTLNIAQLGLLSLLSFLVYRQEKHFRSIFFQFWFLFAALAISAPLVYHFLYWEGEIAGVIAYVFVLVFTHSLFFWTISNIVFTYIFKDTGRLRVNLLTFLVVIPTVIWAFWPYYWSPEIVLFHKAITDTTNIYLQVQKAVIIVNLICLLMLLAFFLHKYKTDRPIGAYADTLLFLFAVYITIDTAELVAQITSIELLSITQWANGILLAGMNVSLLLRLKYKSQGIAEYYESQCLSLDPRIDRRIGIFDRIILWCFFDPKKIGSRVFLGSNSTRVKNKPAPRVTNSLTKTRE